MRLVSMPIVFMWMCVFVLSGCADMQLADNRDEPIEVVMSVAGKSNTQIFSAAKSWVAETMVLKTNTATMRLIASDKDAGHLLAQGVARLPCDGGGVNCLLRKNHQLNFTMRIEVKEGKFKMTFIDLTVVIPPAGQENNPHPTGAHSYGLTAKSDVDAANKAAQILAQELVAYINKQTNKNW